MMIFQKKNRAAMLKFISLFLISCSLVGAVLSTTVVTSQLTDGDPDLEAYLREAIENFRDQMTKGIPAIKMPVLDPLELHDIDVDVQENVATINLHINEMVIKELSNFTIHDIAPDLEKLFLEVNLSIPAINAQGEYKVNGKIVKIFPVYGGGQFEINVTQATIAGLGQLEFTEDTLQMTTLKLDLEWKDLKIRLENFLGGGTFSHILQNVFPKIGKGVFEHFKPKIMELMNTALMNEVNKELRKPEVKKIVEGILPTKKK